eukprot:CAMPEP_0172633020 /NCGR_PEP_ID=MMETSP1068-20121228/187326_1 /TAXON_ID=35684 /ORGANISM="Pseudopedinella elastica, Strain CCMP716" /LENGTH=99 /DNA_ID=CAMNT_0013444605 /DNA_START=323 /DNA_END=622 /DNA_ORIENTATION=+
MIRRSPSRRSKLTRNPMSGAALPCPRLWSPFKSPPPMGCSPTAPPLALAFVGFVGLASSGGGGALAAGLALGLMVNFRVAPQEKEKMGDRASIWGSSSE